MTGEEQRLVQMNVISGAVRAYYGVLLAAENLKVALSAVSSAEADLKRATAVRAAGRCVCRASGREEDAV